MDEIKVGTKFTLFYPSDRYVFEVTKVHTPRRVTLRHPQLGDRTVSLRKDGKWRQTGSDRGGYYKPGDAGEYRAPEV